jgi:hypothetical protein
MINNELRKMTPLIKVVRSAAADMYEDIGKVQERYAHWAARGLRKLQREVLKHGKRSVMLPVNRNTLSVTLPPDVDSVTFFGFINEKGKKVPLPTRGNLVAHQFIDIEEPKQCPVCSQDKAICDELWVSEEINLVDIDGTLYDETIAKKMRPNGDYYEERTTPVKDLSTGIVTYHKSSNFITNLDIKKCGCLDTCNDNMIKLRNYCPHIYAEHFAECECEAKDFGGYQIHDEIGIASIEPQYPYDYVYMEYAGFMPKSHGQYLVPEVAFETLVEFTKHKSVQDRKGVSRGDKQDKFAHYLRERGNMEKVLGRVGLSVIIKAAGMIPQFRTYGEYGSWDSYYAHNRCNTTTTSMNRDSCNNPVPQVIQTINNVEKITNEIVYRKLKFAVGDAVVTDDDGPVSNGVALPLQLTDSVFTVTDAGVLKGSVNVLLNNITLHQDQTTDQVSYQIVYGANGFSITFSEGANIDQKYTVTYAKAINV